MVSDVDAVSGTNDEWVGAGRGQSDPRGDGDGAVVEAGWSTVRAYHRVHRDVEVCVHERIDRVPLACSRGTHVVRRRRIAVVTPESFDTFGKG